jgi:hypothetical protein
LSIEKHANFLWKTANFGGGWGGGQIVRVAGAHTGLSFRKNAFMRRALKRGV